MPEKIIEAEMTVFEFTLKFSLPETGADPQFYVEQLSTTGCDDAVIGVGQTGRIAQEFAREAESAFDAVSSAIDDVKKRFSWRTHPACTIE